MRMTLHMALYCLPLLVALLLPCAPALAQANPKCQVQPKTLAAMHNCYRPLLVFSPTGADARLMLQNDISGLPVVDEDGDLVGMLTEGDFLRRREIGTERRRPKG